MPRLDDLICSAAATLRDLAAAQNTQRQNMSVMAEWQAKVDACRSTVDKLQSAYDDTIRAVKDECAKSGAGSPSSGAA